MLTKLTKQKKFRFGNRLKVWFVVRLKTQLKVYRSENVHHSS